MDTHQKISIAIFGSLLLGTLAMYGTGGLSSSVLKSDMLQNADDPCPASYMKEYAEVYPSDKEKMIDIQRFIGRNCGGDVAEAKKAYCDARTKQLKTYSALVKKYETCLNHASIPPIKADTDK